MFVLLLKRMSIVGLIMLGLNGCANTPTNYDNKAQWDFDHKIQFKLSSLGIDHYRLVINPNMQAKFATSSVFLIRKGFELCGNYNYQVKVISGVEAFLDKVAQPNLIQTPLTAEVKCATENNMGIPIQTSL